MEIPPVNSEEARLFNLVNNTIVFKERATLVLERTETQRALLRMGSLYYFITPSTVLWFDLPQDDQYQCLTYYFQHNQTQLLMIKAHHNAQQLHSSISATKCQLRQRKVYFQMYQSKALDQNLKYPYIQTISSVINTGGDILGKGISKGASLCATGIEKVGGFIAANMTEDKNNHIQFPTLKYVSEQTKTFSENAMGLASRLIGGFFSSPKVNNNNFIIPEQHSHPLATAGKNTMKGAINVYTGISDGINHLQVGLVNGAGGVIEKKFGQDLKEILQNVVATGNNCEGIIKEPIREVGRKLADNPEDNRVKE